MRSRISALGGLLAFLVACSFVAHAGNAQDKDKVKDKDKVADKDKIKDGKEKKPVGALAPHKLDRAFERARVPADITNALLNDPLFQQAVMDAFKAGSEAEAARQKNPKMVGPTPAQAARQAFLRTLNDEQGMKKMEKKIDDKGEKKDGVKDKKP